MVFLQLSSINAMLNLRGKLVSNFLPLPSPALHIKRKQLASLIVWCTLSKYRYDFLTCSCASCVLILTVVDMGYQSSFSTASQCSQFERWATNFDKGLKGKLQLTDLSVWCFVLADNPFHKSSGIMLQSEARYGM